MKLGIGIGVNRLQLAASAPAAFDPASLFSGGQEGVYYDFSDTATLGAVGTTVGSVSDLSGNGNTLTASGAERPVMAGLPSALGAELLTGRDDFGNAAWTLGVGVVASGGNAVATMTTGTVASQAVSLTAGSLYLVTLDIDARTAGTVEIQFTGGTATRTYTMNADQSNGVLMVAGSGNDTLSIVGVGFTGELRFASVNEVTATGRNGLLFDGIDDVLETAAIDATGSQSATVVGTFWRPAEVGSFHVVDQGYRGDALAGGWAIQEQITELIARDATVSDRGVISDYTEGARAAARSYTVAFDIDFTQATLAEQVKLRYLAGDIDPPQSEVSAGAFNTATTMPNAPITVGAGANKSLDNRGIYTGLFVRYPKLSSDADITSVAEALNGGAPNVALVGDSTVAENKVTSGQQSDIWTLSGTLAGVEVTDMWDVAQPGHEISQQKTLWQARITDGCDATKLDAVIIGIGANDIKDSDSTTTITTNLQDLVDTIAADAPQATIYVLGVIPCNSWLADAAQRAVRDELNANIAGSGSTPITGITPIMGYDGTSTVWNFMDDGSGNLKAEYNSNGDGVHQNVLARFLMSIEEIRPQLVSDGLL